MLLRLDSPCSRRFLTEVKKLAEPVSEFCNLTVFVL
jgi:hypothetical protein